MRSGWALAASLTSLWETLGICAGRWSGREAAWGSCVQPVSVWGLCLGATMVLCAVVSCQLLFLSPQGGACPWWDVPCGGWYGSVSWGFYRGVLPQQPSFQKGRVLLVGQILCQKCSHCGHSETTSLKSLNVDLGW